MKKSKKKLNKTVKMERKSRMKNNHKKTYLPKNKKMIG